MHVTINYLAVVVAAAVAFVLGMVWWSPPLFGKSWWTAHTYTEEQASEGRKRAPRNLWDSLTRQCTRREGSRLPSSLIPASGSSRSSP